MSSLHATDDFQTGNWSLDIHDLAPTYADLFIGFTDQGPVVEFKDLQFGFELRQGDNIKSYGIFPPPNTKYVCTNQPYLVVKRLQLEPSTRYILHLWCVNDGKRFEKDFDFETPRGLTDGQSEE